tara:strand:- start:5135 stop:5941 length:807 start_codon:yes stop_codon:yes gene_type:complete
MKKYKYTSIKNVANWVARRINKDSIDSGLLEDLVYEAAETIMTYESLVPKIMFSTDLSTRRIDLPCDFQYLFNIYYKEGFNSEDNYNIKRYNLSLEEDYNSPVTENNNLSLYSLGDWGNSWVEISPSQTNLLTSLDADINLSNKCEGVNYLFDKENCQLILSENTGNIAIQYLAYPYDSEDNLLVPDDIIVFECIKDYVLRFYWETRMNVKEQNSTNMYLMYHKKYVGSYSQALHKVRQMTPPELKQLARTWMTGNKNLGFKLGQNGN